EVLKPGSQSTKIAQLVAVDYPDLEYIYPYSRLVGSHRLNRKLTTHPAPKANAVAELVHQGVGYGTAGYALPLLSRISYAEMATYLESVLLRDADQMGMAHALEIRVPFLDIDLATTALAVRDAYKEPV